MTYSLRDLSGLTLTGLYIDGPSLHMRMTDQVISIDLTTGVLDRNRRRVKGSQDSPWIILPGWLRITDAVLHAGVFRLDVSGSLYSSQILTKKTGDRWHLTFKGGFTAPPMNPRNL